jgi:rfaE bifunctional protein nucleotidyltransferase chain/domain/rfaE bifunctional protein kinase chain/domain
MSRPIVVVGDTLLDVDLEGTASRLTPDAPVPVLEGLVEHARPGGAGLAARMAARDGREVVLVTALGDDEAGACVRRLLGADGVRVVPLSYDGPTAVKRRVRASGQSLLRLDSGTEPGTVTALPDGLPDQLAGAAAVLVADYGRGVTAVPELRRMLESLPRRVPVVWDPHPRGSEPVPGVRLVTPNAAEAAQLCARLGSDAPPTATPLAAVGQQADALVRHWRAQAVVVTLGARGALLSYGSGTPVVAPAPDVHCTDPCGAGDRFAVSATVRLAEGQVVTEAVQDAVVTAAAYVAAGGPASLTTTDRGGREAARPSPSVDDVVGTVRARGGVVVATGGCFDLLHAGHVATLRAARRLGDCLVVCLNSDDSVRRLKGSSRPLVPAADRLRVLEALECVDAVVVFEEDTPVDAIRRLRPDVWAKGGDYAGSEVPETRVLAGWGGVTVALPYLEGRSTTRLVHAATRRAPHGGATTTPTSHRNEQSEESMR